MEPIFLTVKFGHPSRQGLHLRPEEKHKPFQLKHLQPRTVAALKSCGPERRKYPPESAPAQPGRFSGDPWTGMSRVDSVFRTWFSRDCEGLFFQLASASREAGPVVP